MRYREIKTDRHTLDQHGCYDVDLEFDGFADEGPEAGEVFILNDGTTRRMALATSDSFPDGEFEAFLLDTRYNTLAGI